MINRMRPIAIEVTVNEDSFIVRLKDGGNLRIPLQWFPKLLAATPEQRRAVRISASGEGLRWDQLDEDISVSGLARDAERRHREETLTSKVPADFPKDVTPALLAGSTPKLSGRMIDGKFVVGLTADERYQRWDMCEDLARQLVPKTLKDAAKYPQNSRDVTLQRIRRAIEGKRWTSVVETDWLMERLRVLLGW
jgi:hypothetical protein